MPLNLIRNKSDFPCSPPIFILLGGYSDMLVREAVEAYQ